MQRRSTGRVLDANGTPIPEAQVVAFAEDGSEIREGWSSLRGEFRIEGLTPDKRYNLLAVQHKRGGGEVKGIAPGATGLELSLTARPLVAAQLLDAAGKPLPNALVSIARGTHQVTLRTDSTGRFSTRALPDGEYRVELRQLRGRMLAKPVAIGVIRSGQADAVLRYGA